MSISGDFARLTGTINALKRLSRVPSQVAAVAAPKLEEQIHRDVDAGRDPYGRGFAPHTAGTIKRWGAHDFLKLNKGGMGTVRVSAKSGAGIEFTAAEWMRFAQGGTKFEVPRPMFPTGVIPASWNRILKDAAQQVVSKAMGGK